MKSESPRRDSRPDLIGLPISFVSERLIRELVGDQVRRRAELEKVKAEDIIPESAARWIDKLIAEAKKDRRLMTDQQYTDWVVGRALQAGDRAKFIGLNRAEEALDKSISIRPTGQVGTISEVRASEASATVTFWPDDPVEVQLTDGRIEKKIITLTVRTGTPGWLDLERLPW